MYDAREETKKKLLALQQLEDPEMGGLPGLDYTAETPNGPMQVTRKPLRPLDPENLPVAAPVSGLGRPTTPQLHDKPAGIRDAELEAAQQLDSDEKARRLFETATRQLIGGITRTPVQPTLTQPSNSTAALLAKRRQDRLDALRQMEGDNNAARTAAYLSSNEASAEARKAAAEASAAKQGIEKERLDLTGELGRGRLELDREKFAASLKPKTPKPGSDLAPKGFPAGWELEGKTQPTPKQGEEFEKLVYSGEKMRGMTAQMKELLASGDARRFVPGTAQHSRLKQLATEIMIEGKNVAELGALSGPDMGLMQAIAADPTAIQSAAKDMPTLLDGLASWSDNSIKAKATSLGARRRGAEAGKAAARPTATGANGEKYQLSADGKSWEPLK